MEQFWLQEHAFYMKPTARHSARVGKPIVEPATEFVMSACFAYSMRKERTAKHKEAMAAD